MNEYDNLFKELFNSVGAELITLIDAIEYDQIKSLTIELPITKDRKVDYLAQITKNEKEEIVHIEFQSTNHSKMVLRMLDDASQIFLIYGIKPIH